MATAARDCDVRRGNDPASSGRTEAGSFRHPVEKRPTTGSTLVDQQR